MNNARRQPSSAGMMAFSPEGSPAPNCAPAPQRALVAGAAFFLFVLVLGNVNFNLSTSNDNVPTRLIPLALMRDKSVYLDAFFPTLLTEGTGVLLGHDVYYLRRVRGHLVAEKSTPFAVMVTPLYALISRIIEIGYPGFLPRWEWSPGGATPPGFLVMEKLTATTLASLTSLLVFWGLAAWTGRISTAAVLTIVYATCTSHWSVSSQGLWIHGGAEFLLALLLLAFSGSETSPFPGRYLILGSLAAALTFAIRIPLGAFAMAWAAYVWKRHRNQAVPTFLILLAGFVFSGLLNFLLVGHVLGGYGQLPREPFWQFGVKANLAAWVGVLISPGRGLFFYSPVLLSALHGAILIAWKSGEKGFLYYSLFAGGLVYAAIATYTDGAGYLRWGGGHCYGPRYFTDMLPWLVFLMVPSCHSILRFFKATKVFPKKALLAVVLAAAVTWSCFTQIVGVFCYKSNHNNFPVNIDHSPQRLWDWADNPVFRECATGVHPAAVRNAKVAFETVRAWTRYRNSR